MVIQPQITGRRVEITKSIRDYIFTKFAKLERHFGKISSAHFVLDIEHVDFTIEANIHVPGHEVFVENKHNDMYAAIDLLMDKLDIKLNKIKDKQQSHNNNHAPHHQIDEREKLAAEDESSDD
jgi:putative sigma-54 modulation protein